MSIKDKYKELTNRSLSLADFSDIVELKNQCKKEMNQEYLYLCDILIIDIYINENLLDDALNTALKSLNNIDNVVFQKIYISLLDRIIYVFINKRNYKSAYRYAFMKRNALDLDNVDDVNRWYLEMAYIYAELNQKDKALLHLKAILNNYPDDNTRSFALSNLTKLYIDQSQVKEAKETLNECLSLVYKLADNEGIVYCEYLNAKLYILEKNYKLARQSFQEIFKNIHAIGANYLSIANEYIALLIEMDLYDEAFRISQKYIKEIETSNNLYVKKDFYKNYLKIYILKNKNVRDDLRQLLQAIDVLEAEIERIDESLLNESNEDDKNIEVANQLKITVNKIEKTINTINISLLNENLRDCLMEFSASLDEIIHFDEALYVMLAPGAFDIVPEFSDVFEKVTVYQYKKNRLYERAYSYNQLEGTIVEMIIAANHEIIIDVADSQLPVKDIVSGQPYVVNDVRTLVALPINLDKEIIGCIVFTASGNSMEEVDAVANLKIAGKLLEKKLISLYYQENIRARQQVLSFCQDNLTEGYFYLEPEKGKMVLSDTLVSFLGTSEKIINQDEFMKLLVPDDLVIYQNIVGFIEKGEPYRNEYRIRSGSEEKLIAEEGMPYIGRDGMIKFYVGVIKLLAVERISRRYSKPDILKTIDKILRKGDDIDYRCAFGRLRIYNLHEYDYRLHDKIIMYVYDVLSQLSNYIYYIYDDSFIVVLEMNDQRLIDKTIKSTLDLLLSGFVIDDNIVSLKVKAGIVRFPKDTYNSQEILDFTDLCLENTDSYLVFNNDIRRGYLKRKAVNVCVNEQLKRGHLEILYQVLNANLKKPLYEIKYNISGLKTDEEIWYHLEEKTLIMFEELAFTTLLKETAKIKDGEFYFHISCETVDYLIKNNRFADNNKKEYHRFILCLENYIPTFLQLLSALDELGFRININCSVLKSISLDTLLKSGINGIYSYPGDAINNRLIMYFNYLGLEYLNDVAISDYQNVIARSDEYLSGRKLSK